MDRNTNRMKIPDELKILGHVFKVEKINPSNLGDGCCGVTVRKDSVFTINEDQAQSQKECTLIHEIIHALNGELDNTPVGHQTIEWLAQGLYCVLKENDMLKD